MPIMLICEQLFLHELVIMKLITVNVILRTYNESCHLVIVIDWVIVLRFLVVSLKMNVIHYSLHS